MMAKHLSVAQKRFGMQRLQRFRRQQMLDCVSQMVRHYCANLVANIACNKNMYKTYNISKQIS